MKRLTDAQEHFLSVVYNYGRSGLERADAVTVSQRWRQVSNILIGRGLIRSSATRFHITPEGRAAVKGLLATGRLVQVSIKGTLGT